MRRTDLAIETIRMIQDEGGSETQEKVEIAGVEVEQESQEGGLMVTRVHVATEQGSQTMGKPMGHYITVELPRPAAGEESLKKLAAKAVATELKKMIPFHYHSRVLVIGLGNEKVTPDALGPHVVSKIRVTRQFFLLYEVDGDEEQTCVSALCPGVMASTGMESAEVIRSAAEIADPQVIVAIDALAARELGRINTTIQMTDTGIAPGAGTGNMRKNLTRESTGRKVVAIGVPTVIDAATLVLDALAQTKKVDPSTEQQIAGANLNMIVTTADIDQVVHDFSEIIAEAINITLHPGIYS